jgi:two-component system chemotaxis response regulator CheB
VVVSSMSEKVLNAMNAGAIDFVAKPDIAIGRSSAMFVSEHISKIKIAASANISHLCTSPACVQKTVAARAETSKKIIAIGASTGGTEAILSILKQLPENLPGIVIVQHIPPVFSQMFAERLDKTTNFQVKEAQHGDYVEKGRVLVAPGGRHMRVRKIGELLKVELSEGAEADRHCPSVNVLFESVAKACGAESVGVILTGMGNDGARGLLTMRKAGAHTIGQDKESAVVYGMPKAAYEIGAVEKQYPLEQIPRAIVQAVSHK